MPTMVQAGVYGAVLHYLKAVEATKSKDAAVVMAKMKEMPTDDPLFGKGIDPRRRPQDPRRLSLRGQEAERVEGRVGPYKLISKIPGDQAFRPLDAGGCALVKKS